ncbi:MAG: polysaccharide deacetylase family protein, partial [Candidatus Jordarchaeales archaeon]
MTFVAFTVDLDRDYPVPVDKKVKAASYAPTCKPSFDCTIKGLKALANLLEETGIKATFFIEARALKHIKSQEESLIDMIVKNEIGCHGMDHEDLSGKYTGVLIPPRKKLAILRKATETITKIIGVRPVGFRAPYLSVPLDIAELLERLDYKYDSSIQLETSKPPHPYLIGRRVIEIPLPIYPLGERKASLYTWPLHEGRRSIDEFKGILGAYLENDDGGLLVIATHTWHLAYRISSNCRLSAS